VNPSWKATVSNKFLALLKTT